VVLRAFSCLQAHLCFAECYRRPAPTSCQSAAARPWGLGCRARREGQRRRDVGFQNQQVAQLHQLPCAPMTVAACLQKRLWLLERTQRTLPPRIVPH